MTTVEAAMSLPEILILTSIGVVFAFIWIALIRVRSRGGG